MAKITMLVDDLDGSPGAKKVGSSLDGVLYEIDLSLTNAARIRARLAELIEAARPVRGRKTNARIAASTGARLNCTDKDRPPGCPDRLTSDEAQGVRRLGSQSGHRVERPRPDSRVCRQRLLQRKSQNW